MKVWIVSQYTEEFNDNTSNRYAYIYNVVKKHDFEVKFITSNFSHVNKQKKEIENLDVIQINEPGYKKNVSLIRMYSHFKYAINAYSFLKNHVKEGDIVILAIPSNTLGYLISNFKKKRNFLLVADIHDLWPESLISLMPNLIKNTGLIFWKIWKYFRIQTVKNCDFLLAESREYENMHIRYLKKGVDSKTILLGADLKFINEVERNKEYDNDKLKVVFAGTLGVNYDIETTIQMIKKYNKELLNCNIEFYFFGNGEKKKEIYNLIDGFPNLVFHIERTDYKNYLSALKAFDLGLNSFQKGTTVKYSYKSVDYLVAGLPVLNSLKGEFAKDVEEYGLGFNYEAGNIDSLYRSLLCFIESQSAGQKKIQQDNISQYVFENLDREKIYKPLEEFIRENIK